jgi:hypothetical protein
VTDDKEDQAFAKSGPDRTVDAVVLTRNDAGQSSRLAGLKFLSSLGRRCDSSGAVCAVPRTVYLHCRLKCYAGHDFMVFMRGIEDAKHTGTQEHPAPGPVGSNEMGWWVMRYRGLYQLELPLWVAASLVFTSLQHFDPATDSRPTFLSFSPKTPMVTRLSDSSYPSSRLGSQA